MTLVDYSAYISTGALIAIFVAVLGNNSSVNKKVSRVYKRLDEHKDYTDGVMQSKEICGIHRESINEKMEKIDWTQDKINEKIDKIMTKIGA